ncbi:MAG: hypothetical protein DWQ05_07260 [Calditrichaeota bacterium]|nr:MAG: hypothetical protein DWQ05_07260 [Calditrichota bacterium]
MMRHLLLILLSTFLINIPIAVSQFKADANSPFARNEHPRLFFTQKTLPEVRQRIIRFYKTDFQNFVAHMNRLMPVIPGGKGLSDYNDLAGAARSFAFLAVIDPASVGQSSAVMSSQKYAQKALQIAEYICSELPDDWKEEHHGASNLATRKGGVASLALQVVYDWTFQFSTLQQRQRIADKLILFWDNRYNSRKVKLENHYAANVHIYAGALGFFGDKDLGQHRQAKAAAMMDSFHDVFIRRQLQVSERLFEGSSDWIEGEGYAMDGYIGIMLLAGAAGPALGQNLFHEYSWFRYSPYWVYFSAMPWPYKKDYYFTQHNTGGCMAVNTWQPSAMMSLAAANLVKTDPVLSGLAAWIVARSPYGHPVDSYRYYEPHNFDLFYKFLYGVKHVPKLSPSQVDMDLSVHLGQGYAFRSDHHQTDATLIQFTAPMFWYDNGHNEQDHGAIGIYKFGTLAVNSVHGKSAGKDIPRAGRPDKSMAFNNVLGIGPDKEVRLEIGRIKKVDEPEDFQLGKVSQAGEVEARRFEKNQFDYVNYNYTKSYKGGNKASLARRALVYLRGQTNDEFLLVMDRVKSPNKKYFLLHTPENIIAEEKSWFPVGTGHWITPARKLSVTNRLAGAHGKMIISSLWPKKSEIHKFGGTGREWVFADGTPVEFDASRFGERAQFLLGNHNLQIRSDEGLFLTVMQIGDANTLQQSAEIKPLSGSGWFGALIDRSRVVIFSQTENPLRKVSYSLSHSGQTRHVITELPKNIKYRVRRDRKIIAQGTTGQHGSVFFEDNIKGQTSYFVDVFN